VLKPDAHPHENLKEAVSARTWLPDQRTWNWSIWAFELGFGVSNDGHSQAVSGDGWPQLLEFGL